MKNKILFFSILIILLVGLKGAGELVIEEFKTGNGCPKILQIPACLIILICFTVPLIIHIIKKLNILYFIFTGIAWSIAFTASIMQFLGNAECPKTSTGDPMCYYSLLIFSSLIILKIIELKLNSKK